MNGKRRQMIRKFGGKCERCGSKRNLHFAHKKPNKINGRGRGSKERAQDVVMHPSNYRLLCRKCHLEYENWQRARK